MNNEIQQIAQQNDMNIEFVHWFFNEKKAACGEQWFLALGAMWEGWKARGGEATALGLTLQKSREASGCPAGVDLQDWVKYLVSELSVVEEIHNSAVFITDELYDASPKEVQSIIRSLACMKMPAYARLVAGIKADGVEEWVSSRGGRWNGTTEEALKFAAQLRKGAAE
ncbi:hypothetical protein RFD10_002443 [Klebsiella aerogenes]|uniref:hypothetical protein n=1 Tax=Klebsiella aerogenes TaxID=548 RepID=UPI001EEA280F|nr:hypothetical protein [Klebsiella aerogenes]EKZ9923531.1 hypothetical protein [Klebsiella aerogenes]